MNEKEEGYLKSFFTKSLVDGIGSSGEGEARPGWGSLEWSMGSCLRSQ